MAFCLFASVLQAASVDVFAAIRQYALAEPCEANNARTTWSEPDHFALAALPRRRRSASCARTRNRLQARDGQQQSALDQRIAPEPKFVLAGRSRRAQQHRSAHLQQGGRAHQSLRLQDDRHKRFPTLKKKDEAFGAHRHHSCSVDADAPARPSQRMNQILAARPPLLNHGIHAIDATPTRWRGGVVSHRSIQPARPRAPDP